LKGLSLKDIALARGVSEKTVKQHNLTIYQKSGLAGRAELSAFFLQDLLTMPDPETKSG
jgi:DNA-binding NarL/FixJ family response regulator